MPSEEFLKSVHEMEEIFKKIHKESVYLKPRPIERVASLIVARTEVPRDVATLFSKTTTVYQNQTSQQIVAS